MLCIEAPCKVPNDNSAEYRRVDLIIFKKPLFPFVEIDGRQNHMPESERSRDMERDRLMRRSVPLILRFTHSEVDADPELVFAKIAEEMKLPEESIYGDSITSKWGNTMIQHTTRTSTAYSQGETNAESGIKQGDIHKS